MGPVVLSRCAVSSRCVIRGTVYDAATRTREHDKAPRSTTKHYIPITTSDCKLSLCGKYSLGSPHTTKYGKPRRNLHHTRTTKACKLLDSELQSSAKILYHTTRKRQKALQRVYKYYSVLQSVTRYYKLTLLMTKDDKVLLRTTK